MRRFSSVSLTAEPSNWPVLPAPEDFEHFLRRLIDTFKRASFVHPCENWIIVDFDVKAHRRVANYLRGSLHLMLQGLLIESSCNRNCAGLDWNKVQSLIRKLQRRQKYPV